MRNHKLLIAIAVVASALALSLGSWADVKESGDSDVKTEGPLEFSFPQTYPAPHIDIAATPDEPNDIYCFVPQDLSTNATVLFLTNVSNATALVKMVAINSSGATLYRIGIESGVMGRLCTDKIISSEGGWDSALWMTSGFGSGTEYALLELPPGVVADGYIVWNGASNEFDPGVPAHMLPLQFNYVGTGHL